MTIRGEGVSESGMLSSSTTALQTCWIQILSTSPPCLRYVWAAASRDLQTCPILDLSGHQQSPHSKNEHWAMVPHFLRDLTRSWSTCFFMSGLKTVLSLDQPRSLKCFSQVARTVSESDVTSWSTLSVVPWWLVLEVLKQFEVFCLNPWSKNWIYCGGGDTQYGGYI